MLDLKITEAICLSNKYGLVPLNTFDKNYILNNFGIKGLSTFYDVQNFIRMVYLDNMIIFPWDIRVRYCDPIWQVAHIEFYIHPLEITLEYWMCINTIRDAGKSPIYDEHNNILQDMAFMTETQSDSLFATTFYEPVKDGDKLLYPELSGHIQYLFDVIYGIRGYSDSNGNYSRLCTSQYWANKWKEACIKDGIYKYKKVLKTDRYLKYIDDIDYVIMNKGEASIEKVPIIEKLIVNQNLAARL